MKKARKRRRHHLYGACLVLFFFGTAAFLGSAVCARTGYRLSRLRHEGVSVQARVERKDAPSGKGTTYWVHYRFETSDGRTWTGTGSVGSVNRKEWEAVGPTVDVRFLPEDPAVNCWAAETPDAAGSRVAALALGLLGVLLFVAGIVATRMTPQQFERWWIEGQPM